MVKASSCNVGDLGSIPGSGRYPREGNGSILAWKMPRMEESYRLQFMGSQRVGNDCVTSLSLFMKINILVTLFSQR